MKIKIRKPRTPVAKYKPWVFGGDLIRENNNNVKLWRQR